MNTVHQLKGFKANHEKQVTRKAAHSCHKVWLIRPNSTMEMTEEKARSDLWTQTKCHLFNSMSLRCLSVTGAALFAITKRCCNAIKGEVG